MSKAIELPIPIIDQKKVRVSIGLNQEISEDTDVLLATGIDVNSDDALHQRFALSIFEREIQVALSRGNEL